MNLSVTPPNSQESEMIVLGSMLSSSESHNFGAEGLDDNDFYYPEHRIIFQTLRSLYLQGKPADIHLVGEELRRLDKLKAIGGLSYLTTLAQYAGTGAYIEEYCQILKDKSYSRKGIELALLFVQELIKDPEGPEEIFVEFQRHLGELGKLHSPNDKVSIAEVLSGTKSRIDPTPTLERLKSRQEFYKINNSPFLTGIPTGFIDLDKKMMVLEDTNLIVVAGRPSMGKTAFVLNVLSNICLDQNLPIGFISLEMSADQLVERLLSIRTGISGEKLKRGDFTDAEFEKLKETEERIRKKSFFIHDQAIGMVSQVVLRARRLKDEENIRVLAIDYLQLLGTDGKSDSRQYEVAEVSRTLKCLAMELKIPVIVVAQLSRKVEERGCKKPLMSDLRDSGQVEQDADVILFVYRREYYDATDKAGKGEITVAKNRHGPTCNVDLSFHSECGAFGNLAPIMADNLSQSQNAKKGNSHPNTQKQPHISNSRWDQ